LACRHHLFKIMPDLAFRLPVINSKRALIRGSIAASMPPR
jgi:hypothetical protein